MGHRQSLSHMTTPQTVASYIELEIINEGKMKKAYIVETSNACMNSIYALARYKKFFQINGWEIVDDCSEADLNLISTCGFNQHQEDYSVDIIKKIKRTKTSDSELIVCGCLPKINDKAVQKVHNGPIINPREMPKVDNYIKAKKSISKITHVEIRKQDFAFKFLYSPNKIIAKYILQLPIRAIYKFLHIKAEPYYKILSSLYDHSIYYIEACTGCLGKCSYCAIRRAKGPLRSSPINKIIEDFRYGLRKGYKKFSLIGDDLGFYGRDIKTDLVALLEEMLKEKGDYKILLYYLEPMDFEALFPRLKELFRSGRIIDVNIPIQTGSNRITKLMNRNCDVERVRKYALDLREEFPSLNVRTHVIVGFPGETEMDFRKTMEVFDEFDEVGIFEYFDRPNTPASKMPNKVPHSVKRARMRRIRRKFLLDLFIKKLLRIKFITDAHP